jgi:UDP-N-acetylmuramate: L-alanyl-gamma-D-glutamyl-meso-diaminopimelate ligase
MKHLHFIAIGGSVMHQLAIALHQKGYTVSGSDDDIFDPAATQLSQYGLLPPAMGWFPEKITPQIDAVILGMHAKLDNPELLQAQALHIPIYSYPEYIFEQSRDKKRVVVSGSFGKTSITALLMHILRQAGLPFDYLVGARLQGFDSAVQLSDAPLIIMEGDEYLASPLHRQPKIFYYRPHIAILTGIDWDHINVFPTFETYLSQFEQFVSEHIEAGGTLIYNSNDAQVCRIAHTAQHLQSIGYDQLPHVNENGTCYIINKGEKIALQIFGQHNLANTHAAYYVCRALGISDSVFYAALRTFRGAARRLECIAQHGDSAIYKDFAHAPAKVRATTQALRQLQPQARLIACFELHTYSSLNPMFLPQYAHTLDAADHAIVFYNAHTFSIKGMPVLDPQVVKAAFDRPDLLVFDNATDLQQYLYGLSYTNTQLLLMSSGNFGGIDLAALSALVENAS